jgi:hypothetical protein
MSADRLRNTEAGIRLSFELPGCCHAGRVDIDATGVGCQEVWVTKLRLVKAAALGGDAFAPSSGHDLPISTFCFGDHFQV